MFELKIGPNGIALYNNQLRICYCKDVEDGKTKAEEFYSKTYSKGEEKMELTNEENKVIAEALRKEGNYELAKKFHIPGVTAGCSEDKDEAYGRYCMANNGGENGVCLLIDEDDGKTDEQYKAAAIAAFKVLYPEEC